MKYQNRKRLMMADMEILAFGNHRAVANPDMTASNRPVRETADRSRSRSSQSTAHKEVRLQELTVLSLVPILRSIHHWWLKRAENHYLICADVEQQRAREAQLNVAYYQKRAAMARSARM